MLLGFCGYASILSTISEFSFSPSPPSPSPGGDGGGGELVKSDAIHEKMFSSFLLSWWFLLIWESFSVVGSFFLKKKLESFTQHDSRYDHSKILVCCMLICGIQNCSKSLFHELEFVMTSSSFRGLFLFLFLGKNIFFSLRHHTRSVV